MPERGRRDIERLAIANRNWYGEKKCGACRKTKALELFANDPAKPDGRSSHCKSCNAAVMAKRRERWTPEERAEKAAQIREIYRRKVATPEARDAYKISDAYIRGLLEIPKRHPHAQALVEPKRLQILIQRKCREKL